MTKIDELLAVLEMPEEKQRMQLSRYITPRPWLHTFTERHIDKPTPKWIVECRTCQNQWEFLGYNIEQILAEENKIRQKECPNPKPITESLATLAFRLRDEAVKKDSYIWTEACVNVFRKVCSDWDERSFDVWWQDNSRPIHWIIAALIAKELAGKEMADG